jgi:hypothetical protein
MKADVFNPLMVRPYILKIENTSDEIVKDLSINNQHQAIGYGKRYDSRVEVELIHDAYTLEQFLRDATKEKLKIGCIKIEVINGAIGYQKIKIHSNPTTKQSSIEFSDKGMEYTHSLMLKKGWDIILNLMPQARLYLYFYPEAKIVSAENLPQRKRLKAPKYIDKQFAKPTVAFGSEANQYCK